MEFSETQADHFHRNGFFLVQTPFAESAMLEIERLFRETEAEWRATDWDSGWNSSACRFFLVGEPAFLLAEQPDVLAVARKLLYRSAPRGTDTTPATVRFVCCPVLKIIQETRSKKISCNWNSLQVGTRATTRHFSPNIPTKSNSYWILAGP